MFRVNYYDFNNCYTVPIQSITTNRTITRKLYYTLLFFDDMPTC